MEDWYSPKNTKQLEEKDTDSTNLQPISVGLPVLKEMGAKWMMEMAEYFAENPLTIINGFIKAGFAGALDGHKDGQELDQNDSENETDSEEYENGDDDEHGKGY